MMWLSFSRTSLATWKWGCREPERQSREPGKSCLPIGVFLPILLMGGLVGRFFREFSMTLAIAIMISLVLALTTTPMLCSKFLLARTPQPPSGFLARKNLEHKIGRASCRERV